MIKHLKERRQSEEGFTLIELMVVVLIMGILMAIAIPTFLATQGSAHDAAAKSNATNAFTNEKAYYADNQVSSPPAATATLDNSPPVGGGANADTVFATRPPLARTKRCAHRALVQVRQLLLHCRHRDRDQLPTSATPRPSGAAATGCA